MILGLLKRGKKERKYDFPHSERFPKGLYHQHPEKPWIYIKEWDGTWHQDVNQLAQTDHFKEQLAKMRERFTKTTR